jgi:hypothetical protein
MLSPFTVGLSSSSSHITDFSSSHIAERCVNDLIQNGWTTIRVTSTEEAFALREQLFDELGRLDASGDPDGRSSSSSKPTFFQNIPRVLGGMIKSGHVALTRTAHEIRKLVRPKIFELLQAIPDDAFQRFLDFERPTTPDDLSCNPDAVFVSDGKPVRSLAPAGKPWWHIDASRERSFLQSSFVLHNPDASEQFGVISKSHNHFHTLKARQTGSGRMQNDWFLLDDDDVEVLMDLHCTPTFIQPEPGTLVVWFSTTVHTVKPADLERMIEPRVQTYACFGKVPRPVRSSIPDPRPEIHMKVAAVLFGATCRHLPYPCTPEWQTNIYGPNVKNKLYRDVIDPHDAPWVFGTHPHDFTDHELSVYGFTRDDVIEVVNSWTDEEDAPTRQTFMNLLFP